MRHFCFLFILLTFTFGGAQDVSAQHTSVEKEQRVSKKIKVFPNPATKVVNVLGLINSPGAQITIADLSGNVLLNHQWAIKNEALSIPIPNLEAGIYIIRIVSQEQKVHTKFYKK